VYSSHNILNTQNNCFSEFRLRGSKFRRKSRINFDRNSARNFYEINFNRHQVSTFHQRMDSDKIYNFLEFKHEADLKKTSKINLDPAVKTISKLHQSRETIPLNCCYYWPYAIPFLYKRLYEYLYPAVHT
jgi:hypothetical protein